MFQPNTFESHHHLLDMADARNPESQVLRIRDAEIMEPGPSTDNVQGDNNDNGQRQKRKRHHRHTQHQIQELEAYFKKCPRPNNKQKRELGQELGLKPLQVKFWFQNKLTQMKAQHERHNAAMLKAENEKLQAECAGYREAFSCPNCGSIRSNEQQLKIEIARLKEEIDRISAITSKYVEKPSDPYYPYFPPHSSSSSQDQFPAQSDFVGEMYGGTNPVDSVPMPSEGKSIYHDEFSCFDDELTAVINQFNIDEAPKL